MCIVRHVSYILSTAKVNFWVQFFILWGKKMSLVFISGKLHKVAQGVQKVESGICHWELGLFLLNDCP
jgi:hypothetical protein